MCSNPRGSCHEMSWQTIRESASLPKEVKEVLARFAPHGMQWAPFTPGAGIESRPAGYGEEDVVTEEGLHPGPQAVCSADGTPTR